jgi:hypothetical protein
LRKNQNDLNAFDEKADRSVDKGVDKIEENDKTNKQPCKSYLSRCHILPFCNLPKQNNQSQIRLPSLRRKARTDVTEVGTIESSVHIDIREEAFTKRIKW